MKNDLLWAIVIVLLVLWFLGFYAGLGSIVNLLLVIALIIIVYRLWKGKNILSGR